MRIINRTKLKIHRPLWRRVAAVLRLDPFLPAAQGCDTGEYAIDYLRVLVKSSSNDWEAGSYSLGRIEILVCPHCTVGRVLSTYCHELVHAWFESYDMDNYFEEEVEQVAEEFGNSVVTDLGGKFDNSCLCSSYGLRDDYGEKIDELFSTNRFLQRAKTWKPGMRPVFPFEREAFR